ncbi:MAG: hypothetical protein R3F11_18520 [Verrucomicrobiales bacterium]
MTNPKYTVRKTAVNPSRTKTTGRFASPIGIEKKMIESAQCDRFNAESITASIPPSPSPAEAVSGANKTAARAARRSDLSEFMEGRRER